jgi:hypothetical protein
LHADAVAAKQAACTPDEENVKAAAAADTKTFPLMFSLVRRSSTTAAAPQFRNMLAGTPMSHPSKVLPETCSL